jgi:uncharacterized integral membrane protein
VTRRHARRSTIVTVQNCGKTLAARLAGAIALSVLLVLAWAGPASASTVVADNQFAWFYWIGFVLALSFVGWLIMMVVGYYIRVLRPKWRGRKVA